MKYFKPATVEDDNFLTNSEIAQIISKEAKFPINDTTTRKLGQALKKRGFSRVKRDGLYKYAIKAE